MAGKCSGGSVHLRTAQPFVNHDAGGREHCPNQALRVSSEVAEPAKNVDNPGHPRRLHMLQEAHCRHDRIREGGELLPFVGFIGAKVATKSVERCRKVAMKQGGAVAGVRGKKMLGANPPKSMVLEVEFAVDPAVQDPFKLNRACVEPVAGNNFLCKSAAAGNRRALKDGDLVLSGRKVNGTNQAVVSGSND